MRSVSSTFLRYDYAGVLLPQGGLTAGQIRGLGAQLCDLRDEIFTVDLPAFVANQELAGKSPLDTAFVDLPQRLLSEYVAERDQSELGQILETARMLSRSVDRTVVLGIGGSYLGAKALMDACCHPYHNELSRAQRGERPRLYFEGNNVDNDSLGSLLELLPSDARGSDIDRRWAIIVISKSGETLETAAAFRIALQALTKAVGGDEGELARLILPVTGSSGRLHDLAIALRCPHIFRVPEGVGGRFSVLTSVGLLPAAVLGLDVVQLLRGAAAMTEHFRTAPAADNLVLNYTAVCHLMERCRGATIRVLQVWSKTLESLGLWYDQLLAESLGKALATGATPLTVVNTRDLHSRAQQHQEGRRDKVYTNLIVDTWRRDPLRLPASDNNQDDLNQLAGETFPEIMTAAIRGTNRAYNDAGRPTADLHLPVVNEHTLGQFMQMMMLATVVEGRLLGVNPYGQPGVEAYTKNMNHELSSRCDPRNRGRGDSLRHLEETTDGN